MKIIGGISYCILWAIECEWIIFWWTGKLYKIMYEISNKSRLEIYQDFETAWLKIAMMSG